MMAGLSAAMGMAISDPLFWMPLAMAGLVMVLLLGLVLLDGIAVGVGVLLPWLAPSQRHEVLGLMAPWQRANERWLPLLLGVSMAAFPLAWSQMIEGLYAPLLMLAVGALLRSLAIRGERMVWLYGSASVIGAVGFGLLLAAYATGQRFHWSFVAFDVVMSVSMLAVFALLAASWLLIKRPADAPANAPVHVPVHVLAKRLTGLAAAAARFTAAGMVALSLMLALANPAIFYKWTHNNHLHIAGIWWLVMLAAFVWLDRLLRSWCDTDVPIEPRVRLPVLLTWLLMGLMFAGLLYSVFPFLVIDEITIWDAAASAESMSMVVWLAIPLTAIALCVQVWDYRFLLSRVVTS
jgi:cytochrome d ubiquinol oxidase subunit II